MYLDLADTLRVRLDTMPSGTPLSPEAVLAAEFGVARNTLRRALAVLEGEGLVETHDGVGGFARGATATASVRAPQYRRSADDLRVGIAAGRWKAGERLPSASVLRTRYGVSRATVRRALGVLSADGLIVGHRGKGHFVRDS